MARSRPVRVAVVGDHDTALFAAAADRLGWQVVAAAGTGAQEIRSATNSDVVHIDDIVDRFGPSDAAIVVVGTDPARRFDDADRLTERGVDVVLIPTVDTRRAPGAGRPGSIVVGDPIPMAPAVQRWLRIVSELDQVDHLSVRASEGFVFSASSVAILAGRVAGWPSAERVDVVVDDDDDPGGVGSRSRMEAQAAGPDDAVRLELFPMPMVEHNGHGVALRVQRHPADAFGAAALLSSFAADLTAGNTPVLGRSFLDEVMALQAKR